MSANKRTEESMQSAVADPLALESLQTQPPPVRGPSAESLAAEGVTFGHYLTRAREARGISLDDLAHQTKIRRIILEQLEHNARRELPEKVFVLGYVRSYATAVGLNVEEAVQRCSAAWDDANGQIARGQAEAAKRSWAWVWPTLASVGAGGAIWFIIHL